MNATQLTLPVGDRTMPAALVVGGYGALGSAIVVELAAHGMCVLRSSRDERRSGSDAVVLASDDDVRALPSLHAAVWAHGINVNDSVTNFTDDDLDEMLDVNVSLIARQLRLMVSTGRLSRGSRVVVISSIWESLARPGKFSYTVSKAAVGGLVRAAALDLAAEGILVNAVLPGVVDTPMTRRMLSRDQRSVVESGTGSGRMVVPEDVASVVGYLASEQNTGVTGQSIVVDLGFSVGRLV